MSRAQTFECLIPLALHFVIHLDYLDRIDSQIWKGREAKGDGVLHLSHISVHQRLYDHVHSKSNETKMVLLYACLLPRLNSGLPYLVSKKDLNNIQGFVRNMDTYLARYFTLCSTQLGQIAAARFLVKT